MKVVEEEVRVPGRGCEIRTAVLTPAGAGRRPGELLYTDIFQLTESTLRSARRLAAAGFVVCVPEIYPRGPRAGVALEFDDDGKAKGREGAKSTADTDNDTKHTANLDFMQRHPGITELLVTGFCIGGHLAFRAAFDPRVAATVCFNATGLHDGALGADPDAGSLARAAEIRGRLMLVFGSRDPLVPPPARIEILSTLHAMGLTDVELHVYQGGEHAFMRDVGARYDPRLTDLALAEAVSFFTGR